MPMGQRKAAKPKATQQQQQVPVQGVPHSMLQLPPLDAAAAPVPEVSLSTLQQLEDKKKRLSHQLKDVEKQIFDLETRYLEACNPNANALTGYEGLRNSMGSSKPAKAAAVQEDRIFSGSSVSTTAR